MSTDAQQTQQSQQRYQQFVQLLPLTLAIAGLSHTDPGKYLTEEQMEIRARTVRNAYKAAKTVIRDVVLES